MKSTKTMNLQRIILLGLAAMLLLGPAIVVADPPERGYEFHAFDVPAALGSLTSAYGINNRGVIVGNFLAAADNTAHGFYFERGHFTDVIVPGSSVDEFTDRGSLIDVNDRGTAVGIFNDAETGLLQGYLRTRQGTITVLPSPEPDQDFEPEGINNRGTIVGRSGFFPAFHGVIQRDGVSTLYDYPEAVGTALTGINDHEEIVGVWIDANVVSHGFLLRKGATTAIQVPGSIGTRPNGLNNRGQIVGTYFGADGVRHGFLLDSKRGVYQTLDYPNASSSSLFLTVLTAINDHGVIVGTYDDFSFGLVATPEK